MTTMQESVDASSGVGPGAARAEAPSTKKGKKEDSPFAWEEMWRQIYTPLLLQSEEGKPRIISVTSAFDGEGKTTVALGLGLAIAKDLEKNILMVDCNLFQPGLSASFEIKEALGLANCLAGEVPVGSIIRPTGLKNLWVVPSGPQVANPSKLFRSSLMADVVREVRTKYDIVILDTPSMLSHSDARVLVSYSDTLLLVVRIGRSTTKTVAEVLEVVEGVSNRWIIVNDYRSAIPGPIQRLLLRI